jgi:hypothetical protein
MKICFIYDFEPNEKFLRIMSKMTPGRSGIWKDMIAVTDPEEADYQIVIDDTCYPVSPGKVIYVSAHPYMDGYKGYYNIDGKPCVARLDLRKTFGFGEWWLSHDYDYLSQLKPMKKVKKLCCIMSDSNGGYGREERKEFLRRICGRHTGEIDIYGRIKPDGNLLAHYKGELGVNTWDAYWFGKEDVLEDYQYSIEIDVGLTKHYFSERFFDAMLMWCMPLYWGGTNVEDYIPKDSFRYIDIMGHGDDVMEIVNSGYYNLDAMAEARDLLLNKYQLWARVYDLIKSL